MERDERLSELAEAVSDREPMDWKKVVREAPEEDRAVVRALAQLSKLSDAHASIGDESGTQTDAALPRVVGLPKAGNWGSLEILERIGVGAYGDVYRARDNLDREVALKLISTQRRKLRLDDASLVDEGRLLARVKHSNVVAVYGADRNEGNVGIWMELIRGQTLHELVARSGPLGPREAALVGIDLCRALAALHAQGIVHRDVKAQNVMREEGGRIVLMDLGIGREVPSDDQLNPSIAGTPAYLAPELLEGRPASPRSDIYGLGVLLFYLVTGEFPLRCDTMTELVRAHEEGRVKLLRDVRPDLDERFVRVAEGALQRDPARRFATAGHFERALRTAIGAERRPALTRYAPMAAAAALVLLSLASVIVWRGWLAPPSSPEPREARRQILIEDPVNRTQQELFDRPLRDLLRISMDDSPSLVVMPRGRVFEILPQLGLPDVERIDHATGRLLAAQARSLAILVTTEIDSIDAGHRITVSARDPTDQLLATSAATIPCSPASEPDVQPCAVDGTVFVARIDDLTSALRVQLGESDVALNRTPLTQATSRDVSALRRYSEAEEIMAKGGAVEDAIALLETAVDLDPDFPMAWSRLALYLVGISRHDEALDAANRAQTLADRVPETERFIIAGAVAVANWRYREAIENFEKARMLGSNDRTLLRQLPQAYGFVLGETGAAVRLAREAAEAYPSDPLDQGLLALFYAMDGRSREALTTLDRARARFPDFRYFDWPEGIARLVDDDFAGASQAFDRLAGARGVLASFGRRYRAQTLAVAGRVGDAINELERSIPQDVAGEYRGNDADNLRFLAMLHILNGAPNEAAYYLRRLAEYSPTHLASLRQLRHTALLAVQIDQPELARELLARLEQLDTQHTSNLSTAAVAQVRGMLAARQDPSAARFHLDDAWRLWPDPITLRSLADFWLQQATAETDGGDEAAARVAYERALRYLEEVRAKKGWTMHRYFGLPWALALPDLAFCMAQLGEIDAARRTYDEFLELWREGDEDLEILVRTRARRIALGN